LVNKIRALIVEDSENDLLLLLRQLRKGGYDVIYECVDSAHSMYAAVQHQIFDLVIADYALPGFSGLAALQVHKDCGLDIPFILLSGNIGEEIAVEAMKAGVNDYVMKGNMDRLLPAVERELREAESRRKRYRTEKIQEAIYKISESASEAENLDKLYASIHHIVAELMPANNFYIALVDPSSQLLSYPYFVNEYEPTPTPSQLGNGLNEYVLQNGKPMLVTDSDYQELVNAGSVEILSPIPKVWLCTPLKTKDKLIGVLSVKSYTDGQNFGEDELTILSFVSTQVAMAITRKQAEEALKQGEARYRSLVENSPLSLWEEDFSEVYKYLNSIRQQGVTDLKDYLEKNPLAVAEAMRKIIVLDVNQATLKLYAADSKEQLINNIDKILCQETLPMIIDELMAIADGKQNFIGSSVNYRLNGEKIDCSLIWSTHPEYNQQMSSVIVSIIDVTERKLAEKQIQSQLERLASLRTVDMAINASLDLRVTLDVLLDQVKLQLQVDAAGIMLLNPHTQLLTYTAGRGFRSNAFSRINLHLRDGYAGRAVIERRLLAFPNFSKTEALPIQRQLGGENFQAYFVVPLIAKGQIKGVLEVFNRRPLNPSADWLEFLETLAGQAAIALDNASLFENLQRSNVELAMAYEATIEGWSRALDLRDKETEGHTERVTELTLLLASTMGLPEDDLIHIRRGALLHDIGKMGISDNILLKPGELTAEEWKIMRMHPVYAYEMLSPIAYLRPSLDIPYCHHERWDGSGYPRQLRYEEIPLAARIFSVVDVWDALRSDRPYRNAWPEDAVCRYLVMQKGQHFEPYLVDLFLNFLKENGQCKNT
jgi:PAS domain S-box-containing protein